MDASKSGFVDLEKLYNFKDFQMADEIILRNANLLREEISHWKVMYK